MLDMTIAQIEAELKKLKDADLKQRQRIVAIEDMLLAIFALVSGLVKSIRKVASRLPQRMTGETGSDQDTLFKDKVPRVLPPEAEQDAPTDWRMAVSALTGDELREHDRLSRLMREMERRRLDSIIAKLKAEKEALEAATAKAKVAKTTGGPTLED